ncbi:MAG TPA: hypothetical protein VLN42_00735 [Casimicrobiaceae bacterium]|nr:hypothetical protein [Casimicrobiaceae bacterium]
MYTNQRTISRVLAAAVASTGFAVAPMPAFSTALSCAGGSFSVTPDGKGNFNVNCTAPDSAATCSLSASTTSLPASGGLVTLTASNCGTVTSWAKNSIQIAQSGNTWSETIPANTGSQSLNFTFTVQGSSADSVTITEAAPGSTSPPPTGGAISCPGYASTLVYDLPWTAKSLINTKGFGNSAIVVGRFTTPAAISTGTGNVFSAEIQQPAVFRSASISTVPCDLAGTGVGKIAVWNGNTKGPSVTYQVGGTLSAQTFLTGGTRAVLQPSTTYYFNIVNRNFDGSPSCTASTCEMILQLTKATGT